MYYFLFLLTLVPDMSDVFHFIYLFIFFVFLPFLGPLPAAYGGSQARGRIGAAAASLCHNHSNIRSELHLQPTPQHLATPDP